MVRSIALNVKWYLDPIFPWQHGYSVDVVGTPTYYVTVTDHQTGYFASVLAGTASELQHVIASVKSWRSNEHV